MKKLLCVVPGLLLFAMIGAPNARADSYTPTFTCTGTCSTAGLPTAPDVSFPSPTEITITWGNAQPLTFTDLGEPTDSYTWFDQTSVNDGEVVENAYVDDVTTNEFQSHTGFAFDSPVGQETGTLTFSPASAATPEPSPAILLLLGAGLIFLMRKRFVPPAVRIA